MLEISCIYYTSDTRQHLATSGSDEGIGQIRPAPWFRECIAFDRKRIQLHQCI